VSTALKRFQKHSLRDLPGDGGIERASRPSPAFRPVSWEDMSTVDTPAALPWYQLEAIDSNWQDQPPAQTLDTEWLLTNGLGGFASGSVCGCNTRRYHGLLTTARRPPVQRVNALSGVNETVDVGGVRYELACHEFISPQGPEVFHPAGWRYLRNFAKELTCRWTYELGPVLLTRELELAWQRPLGCLRYQLRPGPTALTQSIHPQIRLALQPLVALRDFHHLPRRGQEPDFQVTSTDTSFCVQREGQPALYLEFDGGQAVVEPDWWMGFRKRRESERHQDDVEDLFTPGHFEFSAEQTTEPITLSLYFGTEPIDTDAFDGGRARRRHLEKLIVHVEASVDQKPPADTSLDQALRGLVAASDDFVVEREVRGQKLSSILAGYPWFADWGRDTMISLPGLLLVTGRLQEARNTLLAYARHLRNGLVPNRFDDYGGEPHYNTADASLWFIHAALEYRRLGGDSEAWHDALMPACNQIIEAHRQGTDGPIGMDSDGLISAGNIDTQLTWMDAARDGVVFTPRYGKAVELNALWHRALAGCAQAQWDDDAAAAGHHQKLASRVKRSFGKLFWNDQLGFLVDHVNEHGSDRSLRINQVFAVSLPDSPLPKVKQTRVMKVLRDHLLTPMGMRTLSPEDGAYHPHYAGTMFQRDEAYHQGTVWAWPMGAYVEGWLRAHRFSRAARSHARAALAPLIEELGRHSLGQLHEVFDGDPPHAPGGCIAQAWSVAEVLRAVILVESAAS